MRSLRDGWQWRQSPLGGTTRLRAHQVAQLSSSPEGFISCSRSLPTDVHLELLASGRISHPFLADNEDKVQWVGEESWLFRLEFDFVAKKETTELVFDKLDTFATVWLDGEVVHENDNGFLCDQRSARLPYLYLPHTKSVQSQRGSSIVEEEATCSAHPVRVGVPSRQGLGGEERLQGEGVERRSFEVLWCLLCLLSDVELIERSQKAAISLGLVRLSLPPSCRRVKEACRDWGPTLMAFELGSVWLHTYSCKIVDLCARHALLLCCALPDAYSFPRTNLDEQLNATIVIDCKFEGDCAEIKDVFVRFTEPNGKSIDLSASLHGDGSLHIEHRVQSRAATLSLVAQSTDVAQRCSGGHPVLARSLCIPSS